MTSSPDHQPLAGSVSLAVHRRLPPSSFPPAPTWNSLPVKLNDKTARCSWKLNDPWLAGGGSIGERTCFPGGGGGGGRRRGGKRGGGDSSSERSIRWKELDKPPLERPTRLSSNRIWVATPMCCDGDWHHRDWCDHNHFLEQCVIEMGMELFPHHLRYHGRRRVSCFHRRRDQRQ